MLFARWFCRVRTAPASRGGLFEGRDVGVGSAAPADGRLLLGQARPGCGEGGALQEGGDAGIVRTTSSDSVPGIKEKAKMGLARNPQPEGTERIELFALMLFTRLLHRPALPLPGRPSARVLACPALRCPPRPRCAWTRPRPGRPAPRPARCPARLSPVLRAVLAAGRAPKPARGADERGAW